jgi:hypothetical protein
VITARSADSSLPPAREHHRARLVHRTDVMVLLARIHPAHTALPCSSPTSLTTAAQRSGKATTPSCPYTAITSQISISGQAARRGQVASPPQPPNGNTMKAIPGPSRSPDRTAGLLRKVGTP